MKQRRIYTACESHKMGKNLWLWKELQPTYSVPRYLSMLHGIHSFKLENRKDISRDSYFLHSCQIECKPGHCVKHNLKVVPSWQNIREGQLSSLTALAHSGGHVRSWDTYIYNFWLSLPMVCKLAINIVIWSRKKKKKNRYPVPFIIFFPF